MKIDDVQVSASSPDKANKPLVSAKSVANCGRSVGFHSWRLRSGQRILNTFAIVTRHRNHSSATILRQVASWAPPNGARAASRQALGRDGPTAGT